MFSQFGDARQNVRVTPLWAATAGALAATLSIIAGFTQLGRLLRVRTAAGIAVGTWLLMTLSTTAWFAYGLSIHSVTQEVANGSWMFLACTLTWLMLRHRGRSMAVGGQLGVFGLLVALIAIGRFAPALPGWIGMPASMFLNVPQIRHTLRFGRGPGVSIIGWAMMGASAALWCTYGIGTGEAPVILNSAVQALMISAVVAMLLIRPEVLASDEQHGDSAPRSGRQTGGTHTDAHTEAHGLDRRVGRGLAVDALHMGAEGVPRDVELCRPFDGSLAIHERLEHIELSRRE